MICGNGGSAAMSQEMVAELMGKFEKIRPPLPAIALTTDTAFLTAWCNDNENGFETIFSRQIEALWEPGDVVITFSTSGKSKNCLRAGECAEQCDLVYIDFPRKGKRTADVQEYQHKLMHQICREVEEELFPKL